jgi:DNA-binding NarL/FixJ family response regulator
LNIVACPARPQVRQMSGRQSVGSVMADPPTSSSVMIRIAIADDHPIVRGGLRQLVGSTSDMVVVADAATREEALALGLRTDVDVIILDLSMPGVQGLSLLQDLMDVAAVAPVVVLSMHNEGQIVHRSMKLGACAYVSKDSDPMSLLTAIRKVMAGGKYIDPVFMDSIAALYLRQQRDLHEFLSAREEQVLRLLVSGQQIGDIAEQLNLSPKTISTHKMRIMQKLKVDNNADLVRYALRYGIA